MLGVECSPTLLFPEPIGEPVYINPNAGMVTIAVDMTGNGTEDFYIQLINTSATTLQVLPEGNNAVLSQGADAIALNGGVVSSPTPIGATWLGNISGSSLFSVE